METGRRGDRTHAFTGREGNSAHSQGEMVTWGQTRRMDRQRGWFTTVPLQSVAVADKLGHCSSER